MHIYAWSLLLLSALARAEPSSEHFSLVIQPQLEICRRHPKYVGGVDCPTVNKEAPREVRFELKTCYGKHEFYEGPACMGDWETELTADDITYRFYVRVASYPEHPSQSHEIIYSIERKIPEFDTLFGRAKVLRGKGTLAGSLEISGQRVTLTDSAGEATMYQPSLEIGPAPAAKPAP